MTGRDAAGVPPDGTSAGGTPTDGAPADGAPSGGGRADVAAAAAAVGLFAAAALAAGVLGLAGHPVGAPTAPLFAHLHPHIGPGTPLALVTAGLVSWYGPALAARLRWRHLLGLAYATALAWTCSLALVDGWQRGLAGRLTTRDEYLSEVDGVTDPAATLRGFTDRILDGQPDSWTTHVAGHPPGALLAFVGLDRIGLGGGGWAAAACVLIGASVAVTVPVTLRALGWPGAARAAVPFVVLFPGAVWVGASADGLFAGVTSAGVALLACGRGRSAVATVTAGGALLGLACFLSYGLVLMAPIALAVLVLARRLALLPFALLGAAAVAAGFAAAGFWWPDGYHLVVERYYQGVASRRPYGYWVWANLACVVAAAGVAAAPILRRAAVTVRAAAARTRTRAASGPAARRVWPAWALLPMAAMVAILLADLSGLSKAEVERIWLPFVVWFMAGAAGLPAGTHRRWLAVQAATALAVNHLLLTYW